MLVRCGSVIQEHTKDGNRMARRYLSTTRLIRVASQIRTLVLQQLGPVNIQVSAVRQLNAWRFLSY